MLEAVSGADLGHGEVPVEVALDGAGDFDRPFEPRLQVREGRDRRQVSCAHGLMV